MPGRIQLALILEEGLMQHPGNKLSPEQDCCSTAASHGPSRASAVLAGSSLHAYFVPYPSGLVAGWLRSCSWDVPKPSAD